MLAIFNEPATDDFVPIRTVTLRLFVVNIFGQNENSTCYFDVYTHLKIGIK